MRLVCLLIGLSSWLVACAKPTTPTPTRLQATPTPTNTPQHVVTQTPLASPTVPPAVSCEDWQSWPVISLVSETARDLYQRGQTTGNDPRAFSKIGDGEISAAWFFTAFDLGQGYYDLGPYGDLQPVIDYFAGSFERIGVAARRGFNTQKILDSSLSDPTLCAPDESPLDCELRLHRPTFAILSMGTNQVWRPEEFEAGMRQILDALLS